MRRAFSGGPHHGRRYFHISREGQNLDRAHTQFRLLKEMDEHSDEMRPHRRASLKISGPRLFPPETEERRDPIKTILIPYRFQRRLRIGKSKSGPNVYRPGSRAERRNKERRSLQT
jgi:hypothetical protein